MGNESITFKLLNDTPGVGHAGQVVTMAVSPQDAYVTQELDTYLAGYSNASFRFDEVAPPIIVPKETGKYRNFSKANTFKRANVDASLTGAIQEVDPETELKDFTNRHRALGSFVPAFTEAQAIYDVMTAASRLIRSRLDLDREVRGWGKLEDTASWATAVKNTIVSTLQWGGPTSGAGASSDPIGDLQAARVASSAPITDWWFNEDVAGWFLRHASVRTHMRQMLGDNAPSPQVATIPRSDFVIPGVGQFHVNAAKVLNETTGNLDYIQGDSVIGTHGVPGVPRTGDDIATINTFRTAGPSGTGYVTRQVFLSARGYGGGTLLIVGHQETIEMAADSVGAVIFNTLI